MKACSFVGRAKGGYGRYLKVQQLHMREDGPKGEVDGAHSVSMEDVLWDVIV